MLEGGERGVDCVSGMIWGSQSALWDGRIFQGCRLATPPIRSPPPKVFWVQKSLLHWWLYKNQKKNREKKRRRRGEGEEIG